MESLRVESLEESLLKEGSWAGSRERKKTWFGAEEQSSVSRRDGEGRGPGSLARAGSRPSEEPITALSSSWS